MSLGMAARLINSIKCLPNYCLCFCRTIARRAERSIVPLVRCGEADAAVQRYMNRLSDYLFVCARFVAHKQGLPETIYKKAK